MTDTGNIDLLNQKAWKVRVSDSTLAFQLAEEAKVLSSSIKYDLGLAQSSRTIGFCLIRLARYDEAKITLHEANNLFTELKDLKGLASVYEYLGIIDRISGNLRLSVDHINAALTLSKQTKFLENEITNHYQLGVTYRALGNFNKALESLFEALNLSKQSSNDLMTGYSLNVIGSIYYQMGNYEKSLEFYKEGLKLRLESGDKWGEAGSLDNIGTVNMKLENWNDAVTYCNQSLRLCKEIGDEKGQSNALIHLAEINYKTNQWDNAYKLCQNSLQIRKAGGNKKGQVESLLLLSELQKSSNNNKDQNEVISTLKEALTIAGEIKSSTLLSSVHYALYEHHKKNNSFSNSLKHLEIYNTIEKEQHKSMVDQKILNLEISHHSDEVEKEAEIHRLKNVELVKLNKEIEAQKVTVEKTLQELIDTQNQLIQSEKMASLGELTAGIAHEIQNPLNFVNNFADVNVELVEELFEEIQNKNYEEALELAADIKSNEEKIKHHGGRADSIVKAMLEHSRTNSGEKVPTDINALCDEYLRLSYHGIRSKDVTFNAIIETNFDESIGKIDFIPQDIGRVFLNIFNNAFYAVNERLKSISNGFQPKVSLTTKRVGKEITIAIMDNGNGIPKEMIEKIFQPFFTTKPTGQGTGLGLSLSYDIIKSHNGELRVESEPEKGSCFIINLPTGE